MTDFSKYLEDLSLSSRRIGLSEVNMLLIKPDFEIVSNLIDEEIEWIADAPKSYTRSVAVNSSHVKRIYSNGIFISFILNDKTIPTNQ